MAGDVGGIGSGEDSKRLEEAPRFGRHEPLGVLIAADRLCTCRIQGAYAAAIVGGLGDWLHGRHSIMSLPHAIEWNEAARIDFAVLHAVERHARDGLEPRPTRIPDYGRHLVESRLHAGHLVLDALRGMHVAA